MLNAFLPTIYVRLPAPLDIVTFNELPLDALVGDLDLPVSRSSLEDCSLFGNGYGRLEDSQPIASLVNVQSPFHPIQLHLQPRLRGGKGGFGSQLRAAGGRMSKKGKDENNDSCRDLSGRRLSTIKEAKKMAEYVESKEKAEKSTLEARKAKLQTLERQLGIQPSLSASTIGGIGSSAGGSSETTDAVAPMASSTKVPVASTEVDLTKVAQKRHRFDDSQYFETSREINDSVRSAVTAGLLKKRKKAKLDSATTAKPTGAGAVTAAGTVAANA